MNVARAALAVLGEYRRFPADEERRRAFVERPTAGLLQDVSLMADPSVPSRDHTERSRQQILDRGLSVTLAGVVGDHHPTRTPRGKPVLHSTMTLTENARVLVVANCFLSLAAKARKGGGFEAVKGLNHLACSGYVDKAAVDVLSRLSLPRVKAQILARAHKIAGHCPLESSTPVLWPITGDKVPSVFVSNRQDCDNRSEQVNFLARNIPFEVGGEEVTTNRKGNYYICPLLSSRLRDLYNIISQSSHSAPSASGSPAATGRSDGLGVAKDKGSRVSRSDRLRERCLPDQGFLGPRHDMPPPGCPRKGFRGGNCWPPGPVSMKVCFPRARRRYEMGRRLHTTASGTTPEFEDAMILDETTATYAAAFAAVCAGLGGSAAAPGDEHVALRLAQQMRTAAAAYWAGKRLDEEVWVPKGAREQ